MTFLPILEREVRVASRRSFTYYSRLVVAAIGMIIVSSMMWQSDALGPLAHGRMILSQLSVMALAYSLLAGVRSTADCLSEEIREGTLGLLFLTDLKGYDVVFGKLAATSLNLFYGVLALVPVFAIPLLLGGVTASEFGRLALVLVNSLWFALAVGIWVSSRSRDADKAIWTAAVLLGLITGATFLIDQWILIGRYTVADAFCSVASPAYACHMALADSYRMSPERFWISLLLTHLGAWCLLIFASSGLIRHWRKNSVSIGSSGGWTQWDHRSRQATSRSARWRRQLLDLNPILWVNTDRRRDGMWLLAFVFSLLIVGAVLQSPRPVPPAIPYSLSLQIGAPLTSIVLLIFMASRASRFFGQARRTGTLELLLTTPLDQATILRGLRGSCLAFWTRSVFLYLIWKGASILWFYGSVQGATIAIQGSRQFNYFNYMALTALGDLIGFAMSLYALSSVGMWMGLASRKPSQAATRTFAYVMVLPWFVMNVFQVPFVRMGGSGAVFMMYLFFVTKDILFVIWAKRQFYQDLRVVASRSVSDQATTLSWKRWLSRLRPMAQP